MKSTLYLKFILLYIILGFLSIFTVASLSSTLTTHYLESSISGKCGAVYEKKEQIHPPFHSRAYEPAVQ